MDFRIKKYVFCWLFFSISIIACAPKKNLLKDHNNSSNTDTVSVLLDKQASTLLSELQKSIPNYNWWVAKGKAYYKDKEQDFSFTLQLRQQKDTLTWLSVKKVSVEGARLKITPDTISLINYQENEYAILPFSKFKKNYNLPLNFQEWQSLLIGAPLYNENIQWEGAGTTPADKPFLSGKYDKATINIIFQQNTYLMEEQQLNIGNFTLNIAYGNYTYYAELKQQIPLQVEITFLERGMSPVSLFINYNEVNFQAPSNVRFEIPSHYKAVELSKF